MTNPSVFRDKSPDELNEQLMKLKKEHFNLRFQRASGQLEKTSRVREVRRDIARVQTILGQMARGESLAAPKPKAAKKTDKPAAKSRSKAKK